MSSADVRRVVEARLDYARLMCNAFIRLAETHGPWKLISMVQPIPGVAQVELLFRNDFTYRYAGAPQSESRKTVRVTVDVID